MKRDYYLDLAARNLRLPIATDLTLRAHPDHEQILLDPVRLGRVVTESAGRFDAPLAFPVMDLTLEKSAIARMLDPSADAEQFKFEACPEASRVARFSDQLTPSALPARMHASAGAVRYVASETKLLPIGMSIGPFSLATKLLADPITPVYAAGAGSTAADDDEVRLLETVLEMSLRMVLAYVKLQVDAGARAVFIAEPAASSAFLSPIQVEGGSDIFDRYAIAPNRRVKELLASHGVDLIFHCCGELVPTFIERFASLDPAILSLGSSRDLPLDAPLVPGNLVLYGNLPSKKFYSDDIITVTRVEEMTRDLQSRMHRVGHPFILGSECDVLSVPGCEETILRKVMAMVAPCGCC
jgi:uroporphyrinogen-III decarboxylase